MYRKNIQFFYGVACCLILLVILGSAAWIYHDQPENRLRRVLKVPKQVSWNDLQVEGREVADGVVIEKWKLISEEGPIIAYWLYAQSGEPRRPVMILMHGHLSRALDFIRPHPRSRLKPIGMDFAKRGYMVLVPEARYETSDLKGETHDAMRLLLEGKTLMGERVKDVLRSVDLLSGRPEVLNKKIGILGWSMGGNIALYASVLEPRIKAVYLSASSISLRMLLMKEAPFETPDNYVPAILPDFGDKAQALKTLYPRPVFIEQGSADKAEPPAGAMMTLQALGPSGSHPHVQFHWHQGGHQLEGSKALDWFDSVLR